MFEEIYDEKSGHIILKPKNKREKRNYNLISGRFFREYINDLSKKINKKLVKLDLKLGVKARYRLFRNEPIKEKRVVFFTFQGKYTCNSKYIADKLHELYPDYEIIFVVNKKIKKRANTNVPEYIKFVLKDSTEAYWALATAHYWFDNALCCIWKKVPKREGQVYINTWHGSLGIKILGGSKLWKSIADYGNSQIDYFLTNSKFDEQVFSESFWPNVKHLKVGHPRNDIFFNKEKMEQLKKKIYDFYGIEHSVKTVLYAPTFRENKKDVSAIILDYKKLKNALETKFGGEWKIFVRPHFHNIKAFKLDLNEEYGSYVVNASTYDDMQELMAAMDAGITDYSSWIFDYIFTKRPAFIYARDIENYINSRGFYYSLTETPFSIADDDESLRENIMSFNSEEYAMGIKDFLEKKGCYEKGTASETVVRFIAGETTIEE